MKIQHLSSTHEYEFKIDEETRKEILDQLTLAKYYIEKLDNDSASGRLKTNAMFEEFFGGIWKK